MPAVGSYSRLGISRSLVVNDRPAYKDRAASKESFASDSTTATPLPFLWRLASKDRAGGGSGDTFEERRTEDEDTTLERSDSEPTTEDLKASGGEARWSRGLWPSQSFSLVFGLGGRPEDDMGDDSAVEDWMSWHSGLEASFLSQEQPASQKAKVVRRGALLPPAKPPTKEGCCHVHAVAAVVGLLVGLFGTVALGAALFLYFPGGKGAESGQLSLGSWQAAWPLPPLVSPVSSLRAGRPGDAQGAQSAAAIAAASRGQSGGLLRRPVASPVTSLRAGRPGDAQVARGSCCQARLPVCLACRAELSVEDFCRRNRHHVPSCDVDWDAQRLKQGPVVLSMRVQSLDYAMLVADRRTRSVFEASAAYAVADAVGKGVEKSDVSVSLSEGSVVAHCVVSPPRGNRTGELAHALRRRHVQERAASVLFSSLAVLEPIRRVSTGTLTVQHEGSAQVLLGGALDGRWRAKSDHTIADIASSEISWRKDGESASLVWLGGDIIGVEHSGKHFTAQVIGDRLWWDDGDFWERESRGICYDTHAGALDVGGHECSKYDASPQLCGEFDSEEFVSKRMCCTCGGGAVFQSGDTSTTATSTLTSRTATITGTTTSTITTVTQTTTTTVTTHYVSLFCFTLMMPTGYERELMSAQLVRRRGIFACDAAAVYSNETVRLFGQRTRQQLWTTKVDVDLECKLGGQFGTLMNTPIFIKLWKQVISDGAFRQHDWTAKVDADAVFLPSRLRILLIDPELSNPQVGRGLFLNNCGYGLHGPLEVVSRRALEVYSDGSASCPEPPQEDVYLQKCLVHLGVQQVDRFSLLAEDHCDSKDWMQCTGQQVAFHPFKQVSAYLGCVGLAETSVMQDGYNFPGDDIAVLSNVWSAGACAAECTAELGCAAWTWEAVSRGFRNTVNQVEEEVTENKCHLKALAAFYRKPEFGVVSGLAKVSEVSMRVRGNGGLCVEPSGEELVLRACSDPHLYRQLFIYDLNERSIKTSGGECLGPEVLEHDRPVGIRRCQRPGAPFGKHISWDPHGDPGILKTENGLCLTAATERRQGSRLVVRRCRPGDDAQQFSLELVQVP